MRHHLGMGETKTDSFTDKSEGLSKSSTDHRVDASIPSSPFHMPGPGPGSGPGPGPGPDDQTAARRQLSAVRVRMSE